MSYSFNYEALDYASIPPEAITLEPPQIQQASQIAASVPTARQWQVYIQTLALLGFQHWLAQRQISELQRLSDLEYSAYGYWLNAVCRLQLGKIKICLLPLDNYSNGRVEIPKAVVELPLLAADIYLLVEVQEELELVLIGNCLTYSQLVQMAGLTDGCLAPELETATVAQADWSYCLPASCFHIASEDMLLWLKCMPQLPSNLPQSQQSIATEQLQQQIRRSLPQVVNLQLTHLHQFLSWEQAAILLENPELCAWFYQLLLTGIALSEVVSPQPSLAPQPSASLQINVNRWWNQPSQRLLRHVRHKRLGRPQATRTSKRTEPALTVGQATDMMSWQPLSIQTAMRQSLTQIIDEIVLGLQQQNIIIPECARAAYQDFSVRGATMRLYGIVWPLSQSPPFQWTLLLILGSVSGSLDCDVRLTVRDYSQILAERTISSNNRDIYLYTQVAGEAAEQFWVTLQFGDMDSDLTTVYLPPFSFEPSPN